MPAIEAQQNRVLLLAGERRRPRGRPCRNLRTQRTNWLDRYRRRALARRKLRMVAGCQREFQGAGVEFVGTGSGAMEFDFGRRSAG